MDLKYFLKGALKRFFAFVRDYQKELKQLGFGILTGYACLFVGKRLMAPPAMYFSKLVMESAKKEDGAVLASQVVPVDIFTLKMKKVQERLSALALIRSENFVDIKVQQRDMRIEKILFEEGQMVEEGQPLIQFVSTRAKADLEKANANNQYATSELKRVRYLFSKAAAAESEVKEKEGEHMKYKGALEAAQAAFDSMLIKAPIRGRAGVIDHATIGALITPNQTIFSIANDESEVRATFKLPVRYLNLLKLGQTVLFKNEAFEGKIFEGHITAIDTKVNESDILVQAVIDNNDNLLKSGTIGYAQVLIDNEKQGIVLPKNTLVKKDENYYVATWERGKVVNKSVIKGDEISEDEVEIKTGLAAGDLIIQNSAAAHYTDGLQVVVAKKDGKVITNEEKKKMSWSIGYNIKALLFSPFKKTARYLLERHVSVAEKYPIHIFAEHAAARQVHKKLSAVGTIRSQEFVELKSHIDNHKVKAIHFSEGEDVHEGDKLIEFDDAEAQGIYKQAKGAFDAAKEIFNRVNSLYKIKSAPQLEFDNAKARYEVALADLNMAKYRLDSLVIKAPFNGKVGILQRVHVGSFVPVDRPLVSIVNDEKVFVYTKVPIKYLNLIGLGQTIMITLEAHKGRVFEGAIVAIDSKVDEPTQTVLLKVEMPNSDRALRSGSVGAMDIIVDTIDNAIVAPEASFYGMSQTRDAMCGVKNDKLSILRVVKDFSFSENGKVYWVVKSGLKEGDVFVSEIGTNLIPGYPVFIEKMDGKDVHHQDQSGARHQGRSGETQKAKKKPGSFGCARGDKQKRRQDRSNACHQGRSGEIQKKNKNSNKKGK